MKPTPPEPSVCRDEVWKLWLMIAVVLGLGAAYWCFVTWHLLPDPPPAGNAATESVNASVSERRGQFGDMFGGLNALFSGLAFAGVVYALLLQRQDLRLQHEAMTLTVAAMHNQVQLAAETVALQALVAQLEHWQRMLADPAGGADTRERLARETAALTDQLNARREQLDRRLAALAR